jgi:hypothetical protein
MKNKDTQGDSNQLDKILFSLEWVATFENMTQDKRHQFKQAIERYCEEKCLEQYKIGLKDGVEYQTHRIAALRGGKQDG